MKKIGKGLASQWKVHRTHEDYLVQFEGETVCRCADRHQAHLIFRALTSGKFLDPGHVRGALEASPLHVATQPSEEG